MPISRKATAATTCLAATWWGVLPDRTKVGWWKNGTQVLRQSAQRDQLDTHRHCGERPSPELNVAKSIEGFKRVLDMRRGLLQRTCTVELQDGAKIKLETERFISMASPNRAAVEIVSRLFMVSTPWNSNPRWMATCPTRTRTGTIHSGATRGTNRMLGPALRCFGTPRKKRHSPSRAHRL